MSLITKMRKQKAVLWRKGSLNRFGRTSFEAPIEISCRWEDIVVEFLDMQGEKVLSKSVVYVDRILALGDRLKRGEIESDTPTNPLDVEDTFEVRRFEQLPNLKASETLLTAYL